MALRNLDYGAVLTEGAAAVLGGAVQRMAWNNKKEMYGFLTTGGSVLAGLIGQMMSKPGDMIDQVSRGLTLSGLTVAGWVGTEKIAYNKSPNRSLTAAQRAALMTSNPAAMRALGAGAVAPGIDIEDGAEVIRL